MEGGHPRQGEECVKKLRSLKQHAYLGMKNKMSKEVGEGKQETGHAGTGEPG